MSTVRITYEVNDKQVKEADKALQSLDDTTEETTESTEDLNKSSLSLGDEMKNLANRFSVAGKGAGDLATGMFATTKATKGTTSAMKLLKIAIASTGIGLLVIALGSLVAFFTKSQKGSDLLSKAMARLAAITDVMIGKAVDLGEKIVDAFNNPKKALIDFGDSVVKYFTVFIPQAFGKVLDGLGILGTAAKQLFSGEFEQALETATQGALKLADGLIELNPGTAIIKSLVTSIADMSDEFDDAVRGADRLSKALIDVREKEIQITASTAERAKQIQDLLIITRDFSQTFEDQQRALQEANALELMNQKDLVDFAKLKLEVARAEVEETPKALQTDEQRLAVAQATAEVYREQANSTAKQREILNRVNELTTRQHAEEAKVAAAKQASADAEQSKLDRANEVNQQLKIIDAERLGDLKEAEMLRRELLLESEELTAEERELVIQESEDRISLIKQNAADQDKARQKQIAQDVASTIGGTFSAIASFRQTQLTTLEAQMNSELELAGDNAARRAQIEDKFQGRLRAARKKAAQAQKISSIFEILNNTAVGVAAALKWGIPLGPIFAAVIGGLGVAQAASVASRPLPKFADGVLNLEGGVKGKDSIPSLLMPGESVMTTKETNAFLPTLTAIRKGYISPDLLNSIATHGGQPSIIHSVNEVPRDSISIDEDGFTMRQVKKTTAITKKASRYKC